MKSLVERLGLECELEGHAGCVNCLEWNREGSILASGSDDLQIILWDPFRHKKMCSIDTGHQGNIFSVKVWFVYLFIVLNGSESKRYIYTILQGFIIFSKLTSSCSLCHSQKMVYWPVGPVMGKLKLIGLSAVDQRQTTQTSDVHATLVESSV